MTQNGKNRVTRVPTGTPFFLLQNHQQMKKYLKSDPIGWWRSANHTRDQAVSTVLAFSNPVACGYATTHREIMLHSPWHQSSGCAPQGKMGLQLCLLEPVLVSLGQVAIALCPACYPPLTFGRKWRIVSISSSLYTHLQCVSQNGTYLLPGTLQASSKLCQRSFRCDQTETINRSEPEWTSSRDFAKKTQILLIQDKK